MPADKPSGEGRTEYRSTPSSASHGGRFAAGDVLAGRYRIIAPLGRGGMGEVYRADDTRLGQEIALKFLPESLAADTALLARLIGEVRVGRQVAHRNVCRLYDLVEVPGGVPFITMELVDGEDLASLLRRIGRLPDQKAASLAHDIGSGLAAAHELGIIHRDLKPANIMVDGRGHARVTDFGLAVLRSDVVRGEFAGTPSYMAPEQLGGEPATTRSDIYSLGLVFFEMFTGQRLFDGEGLAEIRRQHARPKPRSLLGSLDPVIERLIMEMLEERPEKRPRTVGQILEQIPRGEQGAVSSRASRREPTSSGTASGRSIAVLPFEHLSTEEEDEYFSVGLAEEIISDLARIDSLHVISRGSSMRFKGAGDIPAVARELGVVHVLTGSIRRVGTQLRITANLIDGRNDKIAWSEKFRGTIDDIFDIQESVARTVATQLQGQLTAEEEKTLSERPIPNPLAYEYYLRARGEIWKFTEEGLRAALTLLERGAEIVGQNPLILYSMAYVEWQYVNAGISTDESHLERAERLAAQILAMDERSPLALRIQGMVRVSRGDVAGALHLLTQALDEGEEDTDALVWLGICANLAGLPEYGEPRVRRLERIDPGSLLTLLSRAWLMLTTGATEVAFETARTAREHYPADSLTAFILGYALLLNGDGDSAEEVAAQLDPASPEIFSRLLFFLVDAVRGRRDAALERLTTQLAEPARNDLQYSFNVAEGLAQIGEHGQALDWLENAIRRGATMDRFFEGNRLLGPLKDEPRFQQLINRARAARLELSRSLETHS
jgi:serine/threonine protein kinase/tetratricopeptide (TPR) repeat protein